MPKFPFPTPILPNFTEYLIADMTIMPHEIIPINELWDAEKSKKAELEGGKREDEELRKSLVIGIEPGGQQDWIFERMANKVYEANRFYHFELNGFYEPLQLAEYGVGDFFDWHLDFGTGASSNRKLSLTIQLSNPDDYEGGDLEFKINNRIVKAPRTQGTAIIFPSFIMHRVTEITKGTRRSIVGWVAGPPFK